MADIQSPAAEIRRGKYKEEERKEKPQGKNIMVCPIPQGDHNGLIPDSTVLDLLQIHKEKNCYTLYILVFFVVLFRRKIV